MKSCTASVSKTLRNRRFRSPGAEAGNTQASWTRPCSSLCSRGSAARFRRRRYEMAETACVAEAQRLVHVETAHVFCGDPGLFVWRKPECIRRKRGLRSCFSSPRKRPGCVSSGSTRLGSTEEGWAPHMDPCFLISRRVCLDSSLWKCSEAVTVDYEQVSPPNTRWPARRGAQLWPNWYRPPGWVDTPGDTGYTLVTAELAAETRWPRDRVPTKRTTSSV